jgi:hypothetical protein
MRRIFIGDITKPSLYLPPTDDAKISGYYLEIPEDIVESISGDPIVIVGQSGNICYFWDLRPVGDRGIQGYAHILTYVPTNKNSWGIVDITDLNDSEIDEIKKRNPSKYINEAFPPITSRFFGKTYRVRMNLLAGMLTPRLLFVGRVDGRNPIKIYTLMVDGRMIGILFDTGVFDMNPNGQLQNPIVASGPISNMKAIKGRPQPFIVDTYGKSSAQDAKPAPGTLKYRSGVPPTDLHKIQPKKPFRVKESHSAANKAEKYAQATKEYAKKVNMKPAQNPTSAINSAAAKLAAIHDPKHKQHLKKYIKLNRLYLAQKIYESRAKINARLVAKQKTNATAKSKK